LALTDNTPVIVTTGSVELPKKKDAVTQWAPIWAAALVYVVIGQVVAYIPNPMVPDAILALNMIVPIIAGYLGGPRNGMLVGLLGTGLNLVVKIPLSGVDLYELTAILPHMLMGTTAGWVGQSRIRIATATTILVGHVANILAFLLTGLLPVALVLTAGFWKGLLAEMTVDLILIMVVIGAIKRRRGRWLGVTTQSWDRRQYLLFSTGVALLIFLLVYSFLSGITLAAYLFILPVVLAAVVFGSLEALFTAIFLSLPLGLVTINLGLAQAAEEISLILVLNLLALAVGELAGNLQEQRWLAQGRMAELEKAYTELREADRLKDHMIQSVSHELRTPLSIIQGYTDLLATGEMGMLNPMQQKAVGAILEHGQRLAYLVEQITVLHQVEQKKLVQEQLLVDILALSHVENFRRWGCGPQHRVNFLLEGSGFLLTGDPEHLGRAIDALLSNAVKFSPEGGEVNVKVWSEGGRVFVTVEDFGIGIPSEQQDKLFRRFYQLDGTTTRHFGGMGLGLALVKEVVQAHKGDIWVESQVGTGSTFGFWLPLELP